jgi:hypothetical protein
MPILPVDSFQSAKCTRLVLALQTHTDIHRENVRAGLWQK